MKRTTPGQHEGGKSLFALGETFTEGFIKGPQGHLVKGCLFKVQRGSDFSDLRPTDNAATLIINSHGVLIAEHLKGRGRIRGIYTKLIGDFNSHQGHAGILSLRGRWRNRLS